MNQHVHKPAEEHTDDSGDGGQIIGIDAARPGNLEPEAQNEADANRQDESADAQASNGDDEQDVHDAAAPFGFKADGTPRKSNQGRRADPGVVAERSKQRQRLKSVTPSRTKPTPDRQAPQVPALAVVNYQAMGEAVASMWFSMGQMALGPEWAPDEKDGEPQAVAGAFRDYFKATQMRDLPPGFALVMVLTVYTVKRAARPTIRGKLSLFGAWMKSRIPTIGRKRGYPSDTRA